MNKEKIQDYILGLKKNQDKDFSVVSFKTMVGILEALLEEEQPTPCPHDWSQGTSGFICRKCGQIRYN